MKICVLGDSHVASLKQGWDQLETDYPDVELIFFASRQDGLSALRLSGKSLVPSKPACRKDIAFTSGGLETVEIEKYDNFLVYGLNLVVPHLDRRISSSVKSQSFRDAIDRSLNLSIHKLLRKASRAPIFLGHTPNMARNSLSNDSSHLMTYPEAYSMMARKVSEYGARLVSQPQQTFHNDWNTKIEFSRGSRRLDVGDSISDKPHPENENQHMNGEFGRIYLAAFLQTLHE